MLRTSGLAAPLEPALSETELVQSALTGDAEAFARLYEAHVDEIFRFVYYRVGTDRDTAEDLTAQVFFKAWDNLSGYQPRGAPFRAWLFQIARNLVIDYYRTKKDNLPLEPHALFEPDPGVDVAAEVESRLQLDYLRQQMAGLTDEQREVLILKFINGWSTKEIARAMKKRQGAIRALQMRALQALADILGKNGDD